jgi:hypothetical protein
MIGPETRGAIPIWFARATASSVLGCRSLKFQAARLKMNASTSMPSPIVTPASGFNFFEMRGPDTLLSKSGPFVV